MAEYITKYRQLEGKDEWHIEAVDVKEQIVRCKDCRFFKPYEALKVDGYKCIRVPTCFAVEPDGFCKWGERP